MIDTQLLRYPEQLAARLSQMERDINELKKVVKRLSNGSV